MSKRNQNFDQKADEIARCLAAGDKKRLASACLAALAADPEDVRALCLSGNLMQQQGKFSQAVRLLDRAAVLAPHDITAQVMLGEALLDGNSLDAALAVLRRAAALAPDNIVVYRHIGRVLYRLARYAEALAVVEHGMAFVQVE